MILALDSATDNCSVALGDAGSTLLARIRLAPRQHNRLLLPMVDQLLLDAGVKRRHLVAVTVTVGPGSFTGLRIAVGIAQGIAAALALPVLPISTLQAMAWQARQRHGWTEVMAVLDARQQERFAGCYQLESNTAMATVADGVHTVDDLTELLAHQPAALVGPGAAAVAALCPEQPTDLELLPRAEDLLVLAHQALAAGKGLAAAALAPVYLRDHSHWLPVTAQPQQLP